jgi:murein DD-endopeptidase MepM/ murein hydrolase activator NlpD
LDKHCFLCPIEYKRGIIIRSDRWGEGVFAAPRRGQRVHNGVDLFAEVGTPVLASRSGKVVIATNQEKGMGLYVVISHSGGLSTLYGHLSKILVEKNGFVRQGDVIGFVGKTGNADAPEMQPHLHFEIRNNGFLEDPLNYLR